MKRNGKISTNGSLTRANQNGTIAANGSGTHAKQNGVNGTRVSRARSPTPVAAPPADGFATRLVFRTILPLFLMASCPNFVIVLWYTAAHCGGSFAEFGALMTRKGVLAGMWGIWADIPIGGLLAGSVIAGYVAWALLLMVLLPGRRVEGPVTPNGNVPVYRDNGFACFVVTIAAFCLLTAVLKQYGMSPTIVYDRFGEFLGTVTVFTHVLCIALHLKGLLHPSSSDCGTTGNVVFDYYWGTELYPRVCGVDVKVFTNCRFGMTVWPLLVLIFALKNYELYGFVDGVWVSTVLQMTYFAKFFWWESGYMRTIDIMLDRAGFYICWGCLVFIPGLYASVSMYLATHSTPLGPALSVAILAVGLGALAVNYIADEQKQRVRAAGGACTVWGRPADVIRAEYTLQSGEVRESLLLVSGWWGVARHFHYVPELTLAFCWTAPAGFNVVMPYSYLAFLTVLLVHRTFRDDEKCSLKYGAKWAEYSRRVPYKMIPGIF